MMDFLLSPGNTSHPIKKTSCVNYKKSQAECGKHGSSITAVENDFTVTSLQSCLDGLVWRL